MENNLLGMNRTMMCGEFRASDVGKTVTAYGWVAKYRNLGSLLFADLRDRTGIIQLAFDESEYPEVFQDARSIRNEYVLAVTGTVRSRGGNVNKNIPTGEIEILVKELRILADAEVTPFVISDDVTANDALRLKYRYLDLRRPVLQKNIIMRSRITNSAREYFAENGFLEIETPYLGKSTPEGARDYLVPSRVHPGEFYALPQSPQLFKQLLMVSGFDKYYQIARCFRDEDLRANRQPEFTQIDIEMSFVDREESVMSMAEGLISKIFKDCIGLELPKKFRRMPYNEAMSRYGSDKPDTRFGLELCDVSDVVKDVEFSVIGNAIASGGACMAINAKGFASKMSRKDIDATVEKVKTFGAKGLLWIALRPDATSSSFLKFLKEEEVQALYQKVGAETGDVIFLVADKKSVVYKALGELRLYLGDRYELYDKSEYDVLWVTEFPLLEYSEEEGRYMAAHHPFTSPYVEDMAFADERPGEIRARAYDLVINGQEAGGGSIRIYDRKLQERMFGLLGFTEERIREQFGWFVDAFRYGAPPHGGLAFGLDRLVMLLTGTDNIKDVIAFPKVQNASCLMSEAPSPVSDKQLAELEISVKKN